MLSQTPDPILVEMPICIIGQRNQELPQVDLKLQGTNWDSLPPTFPSLFPAARHMVDLIVEALGNVPQVRRVLIGRSGEVYHVWTLTDKWTAESRRQIYDTQLGLLDDLRGFLLDFYVIRLDANDDVDSVAAGIPVVFDRK